MSDLAREITPVNIEEELKSSYLDYAMSVIVGRALPDVRDGLKPVHRRVLYAMNVLGNDWNKAYKKSARVVGDVIGKYHPHGDIAVYDTIVRMAQPFSLRYMLVDGQGNFGSVDGDSAAAMRYTEIRMSKIAHELMADLEKETVDFVDNYDGTERIPDVMPTKIPNLLVNGSSGIAVGMATNIPPHNITEVINGCLAYIDDEDISIEGLMEHIPGPDFPTAAIINGRRGIEEAYRTGGLQDGKERLPFYWAGAVWQQSVRSTEEAVGRTRPVLMLRSAKAPVKDTLSVGIAVDGAVNLMAFRRQPDLCALQIALMAEGEIQRWGAQNAVQPKAKRILERCSHLNLID